MNKKKSGQKKENPKKKDKKIEIVKVEQPILKAPRTFGQKAADALTKGAGSWLFIIIIFILIAAWIYLNVTAYIKNWDPWPFIILNLCLSCLAAIQAPIILMSQNRQTQRDRARTEYDYAVNRKAEKEIQQIKKQLNRIENVMMVRHK